MNLKKVPNLISGYFWLDKRLKGLMIISIITSVGGGLWTPLLGLFFSVNLGIPIMVLGVISTIERLASTLAIFPSGFFSDIFGRKKMIELSTSMSAIALVLLLFIKDSPWFYLIPIFQGLGVALMAPSRSAYIIDVVEEEWRGRAYATLAIFQSFGGIISAYIAGIMAAAIGFYWVFFVALIFYLAALVFTRFSLKDFLKKEPFQKRVPRKVIIKNIRDGVVMLKSYSLLAVMSGILFHQLGLGIQSPYLTIYAHEILLFSLPAVSLILGSERLGIFLGHFPSGNIVDRYGGALAFAFHIFITSPFMILFSLSNKPVFAALILFSWGLTFGLDNASRQKLVAKYKSVSGTATAFGIISFISGFVSLVTPTFGGWIWTNFSPETVFYVSAMTNAFGSLPLFALWFFNRNRGN